MKTYFAGLHVRAVTKQRGATLREQLLEALPDLYAQLGYSQAAASGPDLAAQRVMAVGPAAPWISLYETRLDEGERAGFDELGQRLSKALAADVVGVQLEHPPRVTLRLYTSGARAAELVCEPSSNVADLDAQLAREEWRALCEKPPFGGLAEWGQTTLAKLEGSLWQSKDAFKDPKCSRARKPVARSGALCFRFEDVPLIHRTWPPALRMEDHYRARIGLRLRVRAEREGSAELVLRAVPLDNPAGGARVSTRLKVTRKSRAGRGAL